MESDLECSLFSTYFIHKHYLPDFVSLLGIMFDAELYLESY